MTNNNNNYIIKSSVNAVVVASIMFLFNICWCAKAFATSDSSQHQVRVIVPQIISIQADVLDFDLHFLDVLEGSTTQPHEVVYRLKANNVTLVNGVLSVQLDQEYTNVDLQADFVSYFNMNGNVVLEETNAGFTTIGTTSTPIANAKKLVTGGEMVHGQARVHYRGVATGNLSPGRETRQLTVTFTNT